VISPSSAAFLGDDLFTLRNVPPPSFFEHHALSAPPSSTCPMTAVQDKLGAIGTWLGGLRWQRNKVVRSGATHPSTMTDAMVHDSTLRWIEQTVVGLNLCPFAERPLQQNKLAIDIVRGSDHQQVGQAVEQALLATPARTDGLTTLAITTIPLFPSRSKLLPSILCTNLITQRQTTFPYTLIAVPFPSFTSFPQPTWMPLPPKWNLLVSGIETNDSYERYKSDWEPNGRLTLSPRRRSRPRQRTNN